MLNIGNVVVVVVVGRVVVVVVVLVVVRMVVVVVVVVVVIQVVLTVASALRRTETLPLPTFPTTARSGFPSPLKSPAITETGAAPAAKSVAVPKLPSPFPK